MKWLHGASSTPQIFTVVSSYKSKEDRSLKALQDMGEVGGGSKQAFCIYVCDADLIQGEILRVMAQLCATRLQAHMQHAQQVVFGW